MDRSLTPAERTEYERWLKSSSLSTHNANDEKLIAFKLGKSLRRPPTETIRAARGQKVAPRLADAVRAAVLSDPDIEFWMDGQVRRLRFTR